MSREAFERWYMSLHGSDVDDLAVWGGESPFHDEHEYKHRNTWMKYQAWQAATESQQARIDELELWVAAIADDHLKIPDWIQQSARSLLAGGAK